MMAEDVVMLAKAVGSVETEVARLRADWEREQKAFRIDWEIERRETGKHLAEMCKALKTVQARHDATDRAMGTVTTVLHSGVVRGLLAALAAGAGFGIVEGVLR